MMTNVLLVAIGLGIVFLICKRQVRDAYQRGFRNGLAFGIKHKNKKVPPQKKPQHPG